MNPEISRSSGNYDDKRLLPVLLTVSIQICANSLQRQALGNIKLGSNTGELRNELFGRYKLNPLHLLSGITHRFTLQMLTQGLPMIINRTNSSWLNKERLTRTDTHPPLISESVTALWMTTIGCIFEVSGLKQPIQDKANSALKGDIQYWSKAFHIGLCITPFVLLRNYVYAQVVFGQDNDNPLYKRLGIAVIAGVITNPVDNAINIVAYKTAIAKKDIPIKVNYKNSLDQFLCRGEPTSSLEKRTALILRNLLNGALYRILGVGGACILLSRQVGDCVESCFVDVC